MLEKLSFTPNSVSKLIENPGWIRQFSSEFESKAAELKECSFPQEDLFEQRILISGGNSYLEHREAIRIWMMLAWQKGRSLCTILQQLPKALELEKAAQAEFGDFPLGPMDSDTVAALDERQKYQIRDANLIVKYARDAILNSCGYFISELFFSFEAMARVICMGSCLHFFHKTILPNVTVQHKDVFDTLNALSRDSSERVICSICRAKEVCTPEPVFRCLKDFYLALYHLRVLRDYKIQFYTTDGLAEELISTFIPQGCDAVYKTELLMSKSIGNRMRFPVSLSKERVHVERIISELTGEE